MGKEWAPPWRGRFVDPRPISAEGAFRLTAARDASTGRECVVCSASPDADADAAKLALARAYDAHSSLDHRVIARATELGPDGDYLVFDCPARVDLAGLLMVARGAPPRVAHSAADGFISTLREALQVGAARPDPRDGEPTSIGTIGHANVLFARDGRFWLIGFGHNLPLANEHGRMSGRAPMFQAPEVAIGQRATLGGDYVALLHFMRSLVPFMVLDRSIVRILAGRSLAEDFELIAKLVWFEQKVMSALPHSRASVHEAIGVSDRIRELLGVRPDVDAFERTIAEILENDEQRVRVRGADDASTWRVASDGSFVVRRDARRIDLPARSPLRRLVVALAHARLERPGAGLGVADLFAAGWPGERASSRSSRNRVHVAVSTLRKMGLSTDLESYAGAYRLSPAVMIELESSDAATGDAARIGTD